MCGIFLSDPLSLRDLDEQFLDFLEAILNCVASLPCSREPSPNFNRPWTSICLVQMTTSSLLVVWIHSSLTILRRQLYETSGLTIDRLAGPSIAIPECNPDLRQPSRQAEVPRKGCFPVKSLQLRAKANHSFQADEGLAGHRTIAGELCRTLYCVERTNLVFLWLLWSDVTSRLT